MGDERLVNGFCDDDCKTEKDGTRSTKYEVRTYKSICDAPRG